MSLTETHTNASGVGVNPEAFISFCDGLEQAGLVEYARRGRVIARELAASRVREADLARTVERLRAERDAWRDRTWRELYGQPWPR